MAKVIFLVGRKGTSKKGNPYQTVTLAEIVDPDCKVVRVQDFFVDADRNFSMFRFGDEVKATFEDSEFLGGRPRLVGLSPVKASPYIIPKKEV